MGMLCVCERVCMVFVGGCWRISGDLMEFMGGDNCKQENEECEVLLRWGSYHPELVVWYLLIGAFR